MSLPKAACVLGFSLYSFTAVAGIGARDFVLPRNGGSPAQIASFAQSSKPGAAFDYVTTDGDHIPSDTHLDTLTAVDSTQYLIRKNAASRSEAAQWLIIPVRHNLLNPGYRNALVGYDFAPVPGYSRVIPANLLWNSGVKFVEAKDLVSEIQTAPDGVQVELPMSAVVKLGDEANASYDFSQLEQIVTELQKRPNYLNTTFARKYAPILKTIINTSPGSEKVVSLLERPMKPSLEMNVDPVEASRRAVKDVTVGR